MLPPNAIFYDCGKSEVLISDEIFLSVTPDYYVVPLRAQWVLFKDIK